MNILGMYGADLIKAFKLTDPMVTAITDAVNPAKSATRPATIKGLETRGLMYRLTIYGRVTGELTDLGEHVRVHLMGALSCYKCMCDAGMSYEDYEKAAIAEITAVDAIKAHTSEDHPAESDMITDDMPPHMNAITGTVDDGTDGAVTHGWHCDMCKLDSGSMWTVRALMIEDALDHFCGRDFAADSLPVRVPGAFMEAQSEADDYEAFHAEADAQWCDVEAGEAFGRRGDAERTWDAENAALEGASIRAEEEAEIADEAATVADYINAELDSALIFADLAAESERIVEQVRADRLMHLTKKGVFVSQHYMNTMRRIASEREDARAEWRRYQGDVLTASGDGFKIIDDLIAAGKISFTLGDREKRRIRNTCRPSVLKGRKHKASKTR